MNLINKKSKRPLLAKQKGDAFIKNVVSPISFPSRISRNKFHNRFLANARPEDVFKYFSNSIAFLRFVKAAAVLISHGTYFEVCTHLP